MAYEEWLETEYQKDFNIPYNPDWEAYQRMESKGILRFISLREGKNLIGYASVLIESETHASGLIMASFRDIFVTKTKRGHAARLVRFVEYQLSELGVKRIRAGERLNSPIKSGKFLMASGYAPEETIYVKNLENKYVN